MDEHETVRAQEVEALRKSLRERTLKAAPYGYCGRCGARGIFRGTGTDVCARGHCYPSGNARPDQITLGHLTTEETDIAGRVLTLERLLAALSREGRCDGCEAQDVRVFCPTGRDEWYCERCLTT